MSTKYEENVDHFQAARELAHAKSRGSKRVRLEGLTPEEAEVKWLAEKDGWTVYRNGSPDFMMERDGQLRFVEVKVIGRDRVSADQTAFHDALRRHGISVSVEYVDRLPAE